MIPAVRAEFHKATDVLLHEPGDEMFYGCVIPATNGYLGAFDRHLAIKEHRRFARELELSGIHVHYIRDVMLEGTLDEDGRVAEGKEIEGLRELASRSINYRYRTHIRKERRQAFESQKAEVIKRSSPEDLFKMVLLRPSCEISYGPFGFTAEQASEAQGNLCYTRDQMITTDRGIVLARMAYDFRKHETEIVRFALDKMGIRPIYEVKGPHTLEGGDFIPAGDFALIGEGCRTNPGAIEQLLASRVFGYKQVVVVEDTLKDNNQMHLDTYFNIIGDGKAIILDTRRKEHRPRIRVYKHMADGSYSLESRLNTDFIEFMEKEKGFGVKDIEYNKERNFSVNVLCIDDSKVIGVNGIAKGFYREMLSNGTHARLLDFPNLIMAYGGPHCLSQVLRREP